MSYKYYWEDFHPGQVLEAGGASLSVEEIIEFAEKYDPQPFRTDEEKAKQTVFGGLIASGLLSGRTVRWVINRRRYSQRKPPDMINSPTKTGLTTGDKVRPLPVTSKGGSLE